MAVSFRPILAGTSAPMRVSHDEDEQRAGREGVARDRHDDRLGVAEHPHEHPAARPYQRAGALDARRHLAEVEAGRQLPLAPDHCDRGGLLERAVEARVQELDHPVADDVHLPVVDPEHGDAVLDGAGDGIGGEVVARHGGRHYPAGSSTSVTKSISCSTAPTSAGSRSR